MPRVLTQLVLAVSLLLAEGAPAEQTAPVQLSVLSYNTHGLPSWAVNDDPEARFPAIANLVKAYDVVLIQEDWAYHALLSAGVSQHVIERGNPSRFAIASILPVFGGSGLTSLVRSLPEGVVAVTREAYGVCAGWLGGKNDCLATKGFLRVRLRLENGRELDFYDTHLDAGDDESDQLARVVQLDRLAARIRALTGSGALVVAGDFNLNFDNPTEREVLDAFTAELQLLDTGAQRRDHRRWSRIDYILYRSGSNATLAVKAAGEAAEFQLGGQALSDHPAIFTRLEIR